MDIKNRVDKMLKKHDDALLETILTYFTRLGTVIAIMAGCSALIRYRVNVLPVAPNFILVTGIIFLLACFGLLSWVALSGWYKLAEERGYSWGTHMLGLLVMLFSIFFVVAGLYAAIKA